MAFPGTPSCPCPLTYSSKYSVSRDSGAPGEHGSRIMTTAEDTMIPIVARASVWLGLKKSYSRLMPVVVHVSGAVSGLKPVCLKVRMREGGVGYKNTLSGAGSRRHRARHQCPGVPDRTRSVSSRKASRLRPQNAPRCRQTRTGNTCKTGTHFCLKNDKWKPW